MQEIGNHEHLSEDWLMDNLPPDWDYDCYMDEGQSGFLIFPPNPLGEGKLTPLFIPLRLLK